MATYDIKRFLNIRSAHNPSFGPEGTKLSFLMDTTGVAQLWKLENPGDWPEQQTFYEEGISYGSWSPTEDKLIFGMDSGGNERNQLYLLNDNDGSVTPLTEKPRSKHYWGGWSTDGTQVAFSSNRRKKSVFDVFVQPIDSTEAKCVCKGSGWYSVSGWSPDNSRLLITEVHSNFNQDLYILNLETESLEPITPEDTNVRYRWASWGPEGDFVYALSDRNSDVLSLVRIDIGKFDYETVIDGGDWNIQGLCINKQSGHFAFERNVDGYSEVTAGILSDGDVQTFPEPKLPEGVVGGITFSPTGERYALTLTGPTRNPNVYVVETESGRSERWTNATRAGIPEHVFQSPDLIHFPTFDDREIPAFFTLPESWESGNTPVIIDIHGGPESQRRPSFRSLRQFFVDHGYGVFEPNVRGSSGYGKTYKSLDDVEKRMDSVKDIRHAVNWLSEQEPVDEDRIVVYGGSYGGFMVLACMTEYPDLWAAGVDIVGIANFVTFLENTGIWRRKHREAEYGSLENNREFLEKISPINRAQNITAPLLVLHGANDPRVPVGEAEQIVEKVKNQGVPVEKLIFPDEGHGFKKLENRIRAYTKVVEFLKKHL